MNQITFRKVGELVLVDSREKNSKVVEELKRLGVNLHFQKLDIADFVVSNQVAVERKTERDFVKSIFDGRLLDQAYELSKNFEKPVLIIEGKENLYNLANAHPNAIRGALVSVVLDFGIPILFSENGLDTAAMIKRMVEREKKGEKRIVLKKKKPLELYRQQINVLASIPGIGPKLAENLLKEFGSIRKVLNAHKEKLKRVRLIGEKKAEIIKKIVDSRFR